MCVGSCQGACMYMCTYVSWKSNLKCQYLGDIHFIFNENNFSIQYTLISQLSPICPPLHPSSPTLSYSLSLENKTGKLKIENSQTGTKQNKQKKEKAQNTHTIHENIIGEIIIFNQKTSNIKKKSTNQTKNK